jgi:hypothetical protein
MHSRLPREEQHHQGGEKHHVAGQCEEDKEPDALEAFTRALVWILPVVIASSASSAGRATVNGGFAANSWFFPFNFRWGAAKRDGHGEASMMVG